MDRMMGFDADREAERGLRGLIGAGPSQLGWVEAMRARDAGRPTAQDLADAERELEIVRRNYVPPGGPLPGVPQPSTTRRRTRPDR
jgi:hypothetical protein